MTYFKEVISSKKGLRKYIGPKRIVILSLMVVFMTYIWAQYNAGQLSPELIQQQLSLHPITSVILFVFIYMVSVNVALPTLPLNLAAGFFWGGLLGGLYTAVAVTLGGWGSFLLARQFFGQPLDDDFQNKWARLIQTEFSKHGWKFVAFARLNPIIPTGPLNYFLGLTGISNLQFLITTFVFLLLPSIAFAYLGDFFQTFTSEQADVKEIIQKTLLASAFLSAFVIVRVILHIKNLSEK